MKRHIVDGAEILRRTPEIPPLAPVVAFEHHLRIDGTGYPTACRAPRSTSGRCCAASPTSTTRCGRSASTRGVPDRAHPGSDEAERRHAVRPAPGAPVRAVLGIYPVGNSCGSTPARSPSCCRCRPRSASSASARHHGQRAGNRLVAAHRHQPVRGGPTPPVEAHRDPARPGRVRDRPAGLSLRRARSTGMLP